MNLPTQRAASSAGFAPHIQARRDPLRSICLRLRRIACASSPTNEAASLVQAVRLIEDGGVLRHDFLAPTPRFMNNPGSQYGIVGPRACEDLPVPPKPK